MKYLFDNWLITIDHEIQNNTDLINTIGVMKDKCLVNIMNNEDSNKKTSLIYCINDESDSDKNWEKKTILKI